MYTSSASSAYRMRSGGDPRPRTGGGWPRGWRGRGGGGRGARAGPPGGLLSYGRRVVAGVVVVEVVRRGRGGGVLDHSHGGGVGEGDGGRF